MICKSCGGVAPEHLGIPMGKIKGRLIKALQRAGSGGLDTRTLHGIVYSESNIQPALSAIKVHVSQINDLLHGSKWCIKYVDRCYTLVSHGIFERTSDRDKICPTGSAGPRVRAPVEPHSKLTDRSAIRRPVRARPLPLRGVPVRLRK